MKNKSLKPFCLGKRGRKVPLPTGPGFWLERRNGPECVVIVYSGRGGTLRWWHTGRPVMDFDTGEYWGPFTMSLIEANR